MAGYPNPWEIENPDPDGEYQDAREIAAALAECDPTVDDPYGSRICVLCGGEDHKVAHDPDCPWLRAQVYREQDR